MSGKIIQNFMRFVAVRIENTSQCTCADTGNDIGLDIVLQ